jgi:hypothetical protein
MRIKLILLSTTFIILFSPFSANAFNYTIGVSAGYNSGPGLYLNGELSDFARNFPFKIRLGAGYTSVSNPGNALDARKIFINNATNGRPEESGWMWDLRMDLLYRVHWFNLNDLFFYGGPRYNFFTANFNFVDGNEDFDITSNHWGWGLGLNKTFRITKQFDLQLDSGLDYYLPSTIYGHDTSYSPDNENVNPREDYTYNDADVAINQPKFSFRIMMGIGYHF